MKNNILIIIMVLQLVTTLIITHTIEKHSVHPVYGDYPQKLYHCYPWDACPDDKS